MAETIYVRGEGGAILAMDLPLPEGIEQRVEAGLIRRVNADGSPHTAAGGSTRGESGGSGSALTQGVSPRPAKSAPKSEWVAWAAAVHGYSTQDADALSKAALQELPDLPEQQPQPGTGRPDEDADKPEWIAYVVRLGKLSAEDAENYTKADLIEMAN
ncbi:hypothetical protein [Streptomyces sp. NPDC057302]|uniref:hypothetical protein n=1 Tax=Streptomyces sp. NPDC057302 TaxID=3346094 RepID=UPI003641B358